jgi:hypothetical protein
MNPSEQSKELLQPILDLMGGADGGVGFAKLRHDFLPDMLAKSAAGSPLEAEMVLVITRFSVLCKTLMAKP